MKTVRFEGALESTNDNNVVENPAVVKPDNWIPAVADKKTKLIQEYFAGRIEARKTGGNPFNNDTLDELVETINYQLRKGNHKVNYRILSAALTEEDAKRVAEIIGLDNCINIPN